MVADNLVKWPQFSLNCKGKLLSLASPKVMGILNLTPDSFYDGGKFNQSSEMEQRVQTMLKEGADIIDVGGYSTRPGAEDVNMQEELDRVVPAIEKISSTFPEAIISIDTFRAKVAKHSLSAGAAIVNDVTAGSDPEMANVVKEFNAPYIIMHMKGTFKTMQQNPEYENVLNEVMQYFAEKLSKLKQMGINDMIIDPGFGFGKSLEHNYILLKQLEQLQFLEVPVMIGLSRKSMINKVLNTKPENALTGTIVLNTLALLNGAHIIRVHDVKAAAETLKLLSFYNGTTV